MFGEELMNNLKDNIDKDTEVCMQCGDRVNKDELIRHKCKKCRGEEIKKLGGKRLLSAWIAVKSLRQIGTLEEKIDVKNVTKNIEEKYIKKAKGVQEFKMSTVSER